MLCAYFRHWLLELEDSTTKKPELINESNISKLTQLQTYQAIAFELPTSQIAPYDQTTLSATEPNWTEEFLHILGPVSTGKSKFISFMLEKREEEYRTGDICDYVETDPSAWKEELSFNAENLIEEGFELHEDEDMKIYQHGRPIKQKAAPKKIITSGTSHLNESINATIEIVKIFTIYINALTCLILKMLVAYSLLFRNNLSCVQRTYVGLWRPNELCDY